MFYATTALERSYEVTASQPRLVVYVGEMPADIPLNPIKATWGWLGYYGNKAEPYTLLASGACFAFGGGWLTSIWWLAIILILLGVVIPLPGYLWRWREQKDDFEGDSRALLLEESLRPLLELAAETTSQPKAERNRVKDLAIDRVSKGLRNAFTDVQGLRVVVFTVSDDGSKMAPYAPAGRQDRPGPFERGTARGDKAFEVLDGKHPFVFVSDLDETAPNEWHGSGVGYKTFISAPIRHSKDALGMLTMDAPEPGSLPERHGPTLALFAAALGVLIADAARGVGGKR
ncbi:MAG: GAF domain-containing protein [Cumulibacter sp.]